VVLVVPQLVIEFAHLLELLQSPRVYED
jgi:hypothetical protein